MDFKRTQKIIDQAIYFWKDFFVFMMAGVGFLTGIFSLGYIVTKISGVWPPTLTFLLNGFNVMLYAGIGLFVLKWIVFFINLYGGKK